MDTSVDVAGRQTLPVIAFDGRSDEVLAGQLDQAFSDIGFCYFSDIGVDPAVVDGRVRGVPALPCPAARRQGRDRHEPLPSRLHGAQDLRSSRPRASPRSPSRTISESFMLMHEVTPDDPRYGRPLDGPNLWPDLPGFREPVVAYEQAMHDFCLRLLRPLAMALGLAARLVPALLRAADDLPAAAALSAAGQGRAGRCLRLRTAHRLRLHHHPQPGHQRRPRSAPAATARGWRRRRSPAPGWSMSPTCCRAGPTAAGSRRRTA